MKPLFLGLLLLSYSGFGALAQTASSGDADASATPEKKKQAEAAPQGPTVIDSQNMDYDEKTRIAIFTGDNYGVFVKDPSFTVNCDKLTAYLRKAASPVLGAKAKPSATPTPAVAGKAAATKTNGLQRAIAEGPADRPVVIVQDKPAANGEQPQHNVGIAAKADYNTDTGDVILTGWPRVSQGINTQIATSEKTIMIMNKDGHTMRTIGPSRTVIQEQDQPKKTGTDSASPDASPSQTPDQSSQ
jgi:lipopolysaccharide export system protein LptA